MNFSTSPPRPSIGGTMQSSYWFSEFPVASSSDMVAVIAVKSRMSAKSIAGAGAQTSPRLTSPERNRWCGSLPASMHITSRITPVRREDLLQRRRASA